MTVMTTSFKGAWGSWSLLKRAQATPRGSLNAAPETMRESRVGVARWMLKGKKPSAGYTKVEGTSLSILISSARPNGAAPQDKMKKTMIFRFTKIPLKNTNKVRPQIKTDEGTFCCTEAIFTTDEHG